VALNVEALVALSVAEEEVAAALDILEDPVDSLEEVVEDEAVCPLEVVVEVEGATGGKTPGKVGHELSLWQVEDSFNGTRDALVPPGDDMTQQASIS